MVDMIIGIDPGKNGAAVLFRCDRMAPFEVILRKGNSRLDFCSKLYSWMSMKRVTDIGLEKVKGFSGMRLNVSGFGALQNEIGYYEHFLDIGFNGKHKIISPSEWQACVLPKGRKPAKEKAKEVVAKLWPNEDRLFTGKRGGFLDGVADAALIAYYIAIKN